MCFGEKIHHQSNLHSKSIGYFIYKFVICMSGLSNECNVVSITFQLKLVNELPESTTEEAGCEQAWQSRCEPQHIHHKQRHQLRACTRITKSFVIIN